MKLAMMGTESLWHRNAAGESLGAASRYLLLYVNLCTDRVTSVIGDGSDWLSMDRESLLDVSISDLIVGTNAPTWRLTEAVPLGRSIHCRFLSGAGVDVPVELQVLEVDDAKTALLVVRDRTEYVEQQEALLRFKTIVDQTADSVMITDTRGIVEYVNPAFETYTGYRAAEIVGRTAAILKSGRHDRAFYRELWGTICRGDPFRALFVNRSRSGKILYEEKTITPVRGDGGTIRHFVSTAKDVTQRVEHEEHLAYLATHDALTGLPNRKLFFDRGNQAVFRARREGSKFALMYLDLDGFKAINDTFGHEAGDTLLTGMARRIQAVLREADTVARLGGDEFCILLEGIEDDEASEVIAEKVLEALRPPVLFAGHSLHVRASLGIAIYPDDHVEPQRLLSLADSAMYVAKRLGDCYVRYAFASGHELGADSEEVSRDAPPNRVTEEPSVGALSEEGGLEAHRRGKQSIERAPREESAGNPSRGRHRG